MERGQYDLLDAYMRKCMRDADGAHDCEHVYRVLGVALDIAATEAQADVDVVIAACLLHDIARRDQLRDKHVCHAERGAEKAEKFLKKNGFDEGFARRVADCVRTHRFRKGDAPQSIEAKILYDADKIDVCGATGIARTLLYQGSSNGALYATRPDGSLADGLGEKGETFFGEYKRKLEGIYSRLFTARARAIARERQAAAQAFYKSMLAEVYASREKGRELLHACLTNGASPQDV